MHKSELPKQVPYQCLSGSQIFIQVRKSTRAKHMHLKCIQGEVIAVVPESVTFPKLLKYIHECAEWINKYHSYTKQEVKYQEIPNEILIPIENVCYTITKNQDLRQAYTDIHKANFGFMVNNDAKRIALLEFDHNIKIYGDIFDIHLTAQALQEWGKRKGKEILPDFCRKLAKDANYNVGRITVRDQRTRWGSCSRKVDGTCNISLNWRAVLLPVPLARQLCHHEICHIKHMNHSAAFHAAMQSLDVDSEKLELGLTKASHQMPWWTHYAAI